MYRLIDRIEDTAKLNLPFATLFPEIEIKNISLRTDEHRWPTLRFEVAMGGSILRFKEFFLDWFYPSFPKSLLKTFSSPFKELNVREFKTNQKRMPVFAGHDYSGSPAATTWISGTTLEIRNVSGNEPIDLEILVRLLETMKISAFPGQSDYISRSFYAGKKREYSWFEEERIGRMKWVATRNECSGKFIEGFENVCTGSYEDIHKIIVFSKRELSVEMWVDVFREGAKLKNGIYRNNELDSGILKREEQIRSFNIYSVSKLGPWILRKTREGKITTIGVSSGISINEIRELIAEIEINNNVLITL